MTRHDLSQLGLKEKVGVYLRHSYAWSGNFFVINSDRVHPIDKSATDVMKFIISGGVTEIDKEENESLSEQS